MKSVITYILLACLSMSAYAAKKPTDEALKSFCRDINNIMLTAADEKGKQDAFDSETAKWSKQYDISQASADQISMLFSYGGMNLDKYLRHWLEPVLSAKAAKQSDFAFLTWLHMPENDGFMHSDKEIQALMLFLNASDLKQQLQNHPDYAMEVLQAMATLKDANWNTDGFADAALRFAKCPLSEEAVMQVVKVFNSIARVDNIDASKREAIRLACLGQYEQLLSQLEVARKQKQCKEQIAYLKGPFACGTLIGGKSPELHFMRAYKQQGDSIATVELKGLTELQGKVILIDFWGTKCVPCIQSFPEMAELQNHYDGKDVVIIGVTSLQGYFADMPNHRTIQCRNNPEKEMGCFPPYMKQQGINWHIAISEENVMNTDFGVLAIPHVTIIDKKGNVRHNAVNADNAEKIQLIDALLAE